MTAEDASGILVCLSAASEEYRDSYTSGALADTVLTTETIAGIPTFFFRTIQHKRDLLMKMMLCI
ncbi:MAG: hypothetical protein AUG83_08340 [Acidobacteria bacterium 13_1_20CM_4_57_11]|nr:MAG: hypothetical protein AUG83_08340 [Acidobacteria bacterium 13_1_20CM_4_57_11]